MRKFNISIVIGIFLFCGNSITLFAQGDGARNLLMGPKDIWVLQPKWMSLNQNITPGNILVKDAAFKIDVFPITLIHNFNLGGRFAQIMLNAVPGSANGRITADQPGLPAPHLSASGFSDGFIGLKLGLINQPSLSIKEFSKFKQTFSMMGYLRVWYSGSYDVKNPLNLGSNRTTVELGFPLNFQLSKNPKRPTWLEVYPAIHMYTPNNQPTIITGAKKTQQLALFSLENHLSHNFTDKFWGGVDLRYQIGGAVKLDAVKQDNKINILGGGVTVGYQLLPILGLNASYGSIVTGDNGAQSDMFKLTAVLMYINPKKLK
jgi:hypothetical protein